MLGDNGGHKILKRIKSAFVPKYPNTPSTVKGKGHSRTGHEDPEREQRYSSTLP